MLQIEWGVADNLKETTVHGDRDFPVAMYISELSRFPQKSTLLHWHEEFQLVIMISGSVDYAIEDQHLIIDKGDILFINRERLHMAAQVGETNASYICIDFHPRILYGGTNIRIERNFVQPIFSSDDLHLTLFTPGMEGYESISRLSDALVDCYEKSDFGWEIQTVSLLLQIWQIIVEHNKNKLSDSKAASPNDKLRIETIVGYMQQHYSEKLTLADLASHLGCSPEECCRLFSRTLKQSPMSYLNSIRILSSLSMLTSTNKSIAEVAQDVGFGSSSYYTEKFKKAMNCKPLEYRKRFAKYANVPCIDLKK